MFHVWTEADKRSCICCKSRKKKNGKAKDELTNFLVEKKKHVEIIRARLAITRISSLGRKMELLSQ